MTLIDRIAKAMQTDDEDRAYQSDYLRRTYERANPASKAAIDDCFIALCGYSLKTLLATPDSLTTTQP